MKTLIRWIGILIGAVVLLGILLGIAVQIFVDPNDYRDEISTAVADATGRTLTIEGDLSLQTFPCCGLRLGPLELSNPPGFPDTHFLRVENAAVSVRLLPLILRQEVLIGDIELDGLDLILISRADGSVNWEFGESVDTDPPEPVDDSGSGVSGIGVAGVHVSEGRILYRDEVTGDEITVGDITLATGEISEGESFELEASLNIIGLAPGMELAAELSTNAALNGAAATLDIVGLNMRLDIAGKDLPGGAVQLEVELADARDLGAEEFTLEGLAAVVRMAGLTVNVNAAGTVRGETPVLSGNFSVDPFSPRELLEELGEPPMETADPDVLANVAVQADWKLNGDVAEVEHIDLKLDDTTGSGWLRVTSLAKQSLEFDLQFDALDVDRYSAPVTEEETSTASDTSDALDLPVEDMRALDLKGRLGFNSLRVAEALLTNVNINVNAKNGLIRMNPLTADIYGGGYSGDIRLDVRGATPKMSVNEHLTGFQLGEFLVDTQDDATMAGVANARVTASASGNTITELTENLAGDASIDLKDGRYVGVDLWHEIRVARARIKGETAPPEPVAPYTEISEFSGTAKFADGMIRNRDLLAQIPFIRMGGSGDINLVESVMDYRLEAKVVGSPQFDDGFVLDDLEGIVIPVQLQGALDDPNVSIDMGAVMASLAEREAKQTLMKKLGLDTPDQQQDDGEDKSQDPAELLKKGLRGLFGK